MLLKVKNIFYTYETRTDKECNILKDITFDITEGEFIALIGSSGAGKTTLIKHLNGLLRATSGEIWYKGENIYNKNFKLSTLRKEVGLVFQYPEHQLFGKTVLADVSFGPLNLGQNREEAEAAAKEALRLVGIKEELYSVSPFNLSGGQMRCVAIAGILAMGPKLLVMDEPTVGLDPATKHMILGIVDNIRKEKNIAILLVSHQMEDVAAYANRVLVLDEGTIKLSGTPKEVFRNEKFLEKVGTGVPQVTSLIGKLINEGIPLEDFPIDVEEAESLILNLFGDSERRIL